MSSTNITIVSTAYTQIVGNAATVSVERESQYVFATSLPSPSLIGHHLSINETIPLSGLGAGISLWLKSDIGSTVAVVTDVTDATIQNGTSGGGGDASASNQTTEIARLTSILSALGSPLQAGGNVVVTSAPTTAVTGTFWQATQPVSVSSLPLPSDATATGNITAVNANLASGTATAGSSVAITGLNGSNTLTFRADPDTDTFVGAVDVQVSYDGSNWHYVSNVYATDSGTPNARLQAVNIDFSSSPRMYIASIPGSVAVRITASAYTSGTLAITARVSSSNTMVPEFISELNAFFQAAINNSNGSLKTTLTKINSNTVATNSGTVSDGTQRVVLATDGNQATNAGITGTSSKTLTHLDADLTTINSTLGSPLQTGGNVIATISNSSSSTFISTLTTTTLYTGTSKKTIDRIIVGLAGDATASATLKVDGTTVGVYDCSVPFIWQIGASWTPGTDITLVTAGATAPSLQVIIS